MNTQLLHNYFEPLSKPLMLFFNKGGMNALHIVTKTVTIFHNSKSTHRRDIFCIRTDIINVVFHLTKL